jgi:NAD(P)-dependent dehydrogenase (short-subunit alcohol dehydrogenase family)
MESILITGSNRGLGLEWAEQYAEAGWRVYATCRHPEQADALRMLESAYRNLTVHRLDVTREDEIAALAGELEGQPIDVLLNNAGVYFEKFVEEQLGTIDYGNWEDTLRVNSLGAMRVSAAFCENVACSRRRLVVAITSHMGSIAEIESPGDYAYRSSKAALNAAMKGLSLALQPQGIGVLLLHPGWVQTRMGGPGATITTNTSVSGMRKLVENFQLADTGHFYRFDGSTIPW